ncbi:MAG: hypothetical protein JW940_02705 [Polyangiaceae bacterium]|nr:hypothetical protein [Polyangiaceae bacterium]
MTETWSAALAGQTPADQPRGEHQPTPVDGGTAYGRKALTDECRKVAGTAKGARNDRLNRAAYALGGLIESGHLVESEVVSELTAAAKEAGLGKTETAKTIASGIAGGKENPRQPKERPPVNGNGNGHARPEPDYEDEYRRQYEDDGSTPEPPEGEEHAKQTEDPAAAGDPLGVVAEWRQEGSLVRYPTGIDALDKLCKGGLPVPWRVVIVGAPSAGKTYQLVCIAYVLLKSGVAVGLLCVDEEPEDILLRFGVLLGFSESELEARSEDTLQRLGEALSELPLRLYDATDTIITAGAKLDAFRKARGLAHAMLGVDSLQAVCPCTPADTPRAIVESNVRDVRLVSHRYRLLTIATSEANRGFYKNVADEESVDALAAGAESRAIEFGAKTVIGLRTPKGHADIAQVDVAKNRRHARGKFCLRLDRTTHGLTECPDPTSSPQATAERKDAKRRANVAAIQSDAKDLASIIQRAPGLGERALRSAVKLAGHRWGKDYLDSLKEILRGSDLGVRLVDRGQGGRCAWHVEPVTDRRCEDE